MIFRQEKQIVADVTKMVTGYKVTPELIDSSSRKREVVVARHVLMYILRSKGGSLSAVGIACNRDHALVVHACSKVEKMLSKNDGVYTNVYHISYPHVCDSLNGNWQFIGSSMEKLEDHIRNTKIKANLRVEQVKKDAEHVVSYALEMMERGNAQGWARHKLRLKVAEVFPEMGVRL